MIAVCLFVFQLELDSSRGRHFSPIAPTGSRALPWNPLTCRLCLPNRKEFVFRLYCEAELSLPSCAFPGRDQPSEFHRLESSSLPQVL